MNERDTRLTTLLPPLMGLLAMVVAGLVDFALYRLQLHVRSSFQPPASSSLERSAWARWWLLLSL